MSRCLRLIAATSPDWTDWLASVANDFYHSASYHLVAQEFGEGEAWLAVYGDREKFVAWPHLVRQIAACPGLESAAGSDVASVYGYPGPLTSNCDDDPAFLAEAWTALLDAWRAQRVVTVFTRFHPILANHAWLAEGGPMAAVLPPRVVAQSSAGLILSGHTVSIDLTLGDERHVRDYQKTLRQEIGRGRRLGLRTEPDESWAQIDAFIALYHRTMSRNHATTQYFFSTEYFWRLRAALGANLWLMVTRLDDAVAAAGLFIEYQGFVQAHLAGSSDELKALSPLKVLLDDVRHWACQRGNRVFHLGGGRAAKDDSLLAFKTRFSPRRHDFYVGGWVLDPNAYRGLCEQHLAYASAAGLVRDEEEFFPRYRTRLRAQP